MKKTLSFLLAAALMATMAVPAFADSVPSDKVTGDTSKDVTAKFVEGSDDKTAETVYSVTVEWTTGGNLTYTDGDTTYEWKPDGTKYEATKADGGWSGTATVDIKVTNRSNAAITAAASWTGESELTTNCTFTNNNAQIASAADTADLETGDLQGDPVDSTIKASVTVSEGTIETDGAKVGSITVTIDKVA